jgi:hypothetical protein
MTASNGKGPPGERPSADFYGNGALWTVLPPGGLDTTGTAQPDGSISEKFPWWTVGTTGGLAIQGRQLGASTGTLRARVNQSFPSTPFATVRDGRFWASTVYFSTAGCWEVTGQIQGSTLRFVVFVAKPK